MKVRIKTNDSKPLFYETSWACAFDFKAIEDIIIKPWELGFIDTKVVIEIPEWYALLILPRSSTFKKHSLIQVNSVGLIDNDYCGNDDTIAFQYLNIWKEEVKIEAGTRIWQGIFVSILKTEFEVVEDMGDNKNRWGFWTTWIK